MVLHGFDLPPGPDPIPIQCELGGKRQACRTIERPPGGELKVRMTLANVGTGELDFLVTTEFIGPKNGLVYPEGGVYEVEF